MDLAALLADDEARHRLFPNVAKGAYLAHSGVAPLSGPAADAFRRYADQGAMDSQESLELWRDCLGARGVAARLLGCRASEVALLGPTSLGISMIAEGLAWQPGDEVICHGDDYPANVYPWTGLERQGVVVKKIWPEHPGVITWASIAPLLTTRTKLVSLASAHYLSGYRPDLATIGANLKAREILFCVDAIQTLGAFPFSTEWCDFASADAHKWLMGPSGQGIVYIAEEHHERVRPILRGSWNIDSPEFVATATTGDEQLVAGAQRFEPGTLNVPGILAMRAGIELLLELGVDALAAQVLSLRQALLDHARSAGWQPMHGPLEDAADANTWRSGILALRHPNQDPDAVRKRLKAEGHTATVRRDRHGQAWLRLAPHGYQAEGDLAGVFGLL